jgi:hypothetical protein
MLLDLSYLVGDNLLLVKNLFFCRYLLGSRCDFSDLTLCSACSLGSLLELRGVVLHLCASSGHLKVWDQLFVKDLGISDWACLLNTALDVWNSRRKLLLGSMQSLVRRSQSFTRSRPCLFFLFNLVLMFRNRLSINWFDSFKSLDLVLTGSVL